MDQSPKQEAGVLTTVLQADGRELRISVRSNGILCEIDVNLPKYELLEINADNWVLCRPKQLDNPLALVRRHAAARLLTEDERRYWSLWRTLKL
jgi:hypothetical protein